MKGNVWNGTQINLVRDLAKYINNPSNEYEVLPGNIGLSDDGLTTQIERYNELILNVNVYFVLLQRVIQ